MEYISHEDFKGFMSKFQAETPKGMLKEAVEVKDRGYQDNITPESPLDEEDEMEEGNAFTGQLHTHKPGEKFKVGGKAYKDTAKGVVPEYKFDQMYPEDPGPFEGEMEESHPGMDKWYEDFENAISAMGLAGEAEARVMKALDHTDPITQYGFMTAPEAARDFVSDLGIVSADDYDDYDADYEEPRDDFDMAGDFNDGEFWEAEMKKMQEIAGIKEGLANPTKSYHGSTANQGDTGWTIDFTVIENTPEYFKIDYVMTPNSGNAPRGASRNYRPEKKYGEWKISKVGDKGQPLTDYEKSQLNIKGDRFSVNGKEFVQDIYGNEGAVGEGFSPDESEFEQAVASELESLGHEHLTDQEYEKALAALEDPKIVSKLWDLHPKKAALALAKMVRKQNREDIPGFGGTWDSLSSLGKIREKDEMDENIYEPLQKATGVNVGITKEETNDTNPPYGFSVLSPDERKQLKEYIESLKTIKKEIGSLLEKAGKTSMMENDKAGFVKGGEIKNKAKAADTKRPAEIKPKYHNPEKKQKPGGNRTDLVMKKGEMWENEGHGHEEMETALGDKLHTAFHKVTDMAIEKLVADGFDADQAIMFLQHEMEEKGKEAVMAQHDPY